MKTGVVVLPRRGLGRRRPSWSLAFFCWLLLVVDVVPAQILWREKIHSTDDIKTEENLHVAAFVWRHVAGDVIFHKFGGRPK